MFRQRPKQRKSAHRAGAEPAKIFKTIEFRLHHRPSQYEDSFGAAF
jgi:hypothetical protein